MVELADIFRRHGTQYRQRYGERMPSSHKKAMEAIEQCRTEALGGHVYRCKKCHERQYSFHSCANRHCPKCQNEETERWQDKQRELLLPVTYYLVTFTLPEELRAITRANPRILYGVLFRASAKALMELASDKKHLGGRIGMVGVLHTWSKALTHHPHIHYLVPGGALSEDCTTWLESRYEDWLVPVKAVSKRFRGKFKAMLTTIGFKDRVPRKVWRKKWVVHSKPVGTGEAVIKYLAPYVRRVAITNGRIKKLEHGRVTFQVKSTTAGSWETTTVVAEEFIRRFLLHVLPKGFQKVRYYGLLHPGSRKHLCSIQQLRPKTDTEELIEEILRSASDENREDRLDEQRLCRKCGGRLIYLCRLQRKPRAPPVPRD